MPIPADVCRGSSLTPKEIAIRYGKANSFAMKTTVPDAREAAEQIAIQALSFLAEDAERLGRFLALSGIDPGSIRGAAREPRFLAGVLDHIAGDERLLLAFCAQADLDPATIGLAHKVLGSAWERDTP